MLSLSLHDLLEKNLADRSGQLAVIEGDKQVSYGELLRRVESLAAFLASLGVRRGDRVAVQLVKSIEEVVAIFAVTRIGAILVNVNFQRTVPQTYHAIEDSGSRVAIVEARQANKMAQAGLPPSVERVIVKGKAAPHPKMVAWSEMPEGTISPTRVVDIDPAIILYTSGSTGKPKGVVLSHLNVLQGARSVARYLESTSHDRVLSVLPFSFDYGLNQLLTTCLVGGSIALAPVPIPSEIIRVAIDCECTGLAGVPPLWIPIVRYLEVGSVPRPKLRYVTNSGGALPPSVLRTLPEVFPGTKIFLMYGLTEAFRSTYLPPELYETKKGSMGQAIPGAEVFVVTEKGIAGPGEEGELVHRGALVSLGYWNQPAATAEKIRPCPQLAHLIGDEKVCWSGDRVRVGEDGLLWFGSRSDTQIKVSGQRLSPTEVEDIVHESGEVDDVVAFGVKDELNGEVVHIAIAFREGSPRDVPALLKFCRANMPTYMVPQRVYASPEPLPRNANGKLDRPAIVAACAAEREASPQAAGGS